MNLGCASLEKATQKKNTFKKKQDKLAPVKKETT